MSDLVRDWINKRANYLLLDLWQKSNASKQHKLILSEKNPSIHEVINFLEYIITQKLDRTILPLMYTHYQKTIKLFTEYFGFFPQIIDNILRFNFLEPLNLPSFLKKELPYYGIKIDL